MGYRLSKIYTRTGDDGSTGLADGSRVGKDGPRVQAIGEIDELNCVLGLLLAHPLPEDLAADLRGVQHALFEVGGELACPPRPRIGAEEIAALETRLDALNAHLPPLREFILPGGTPPAALCHLARAVCRRAERRLVGLSRGESVNPQSLRLLNRLSDFLFVAARVLARQSGQPEVLWQPRGKPSAE